MKKTNREILKEFGEDCSYEKPCEECDMKYKCTQDIVANYQNETLEENDA